jgi:dipeptidyl aminopeptidase/acylaminoacyl peptidase
LLGVGRSHLLLPLFVAVAVAAIVVAAAGPTSSRKPAVKRVLTTGRPSTVTFSPRSELARLDLRTGGVSRLRLGRFYTVTNPTLSPSGALAFIASRCASCDSRLGVLREGRVTLFSRASSAVWMSSRTILTSVPEAEDRGLRLVGLDGRSRPLAWLSRTAYSFAIEDEREFTLSPGGRMLIFSGEGSREHHGIYLVDLAHRRLSTLAGEAVDWPVFAPDGRSVAYQHVSAHGDWQLCIALPHGRMAAGARCLPALNWNDREPAFLPDGHGLVFVSDRAARSNAIGSLYRRDLRTGAVRRLTPAGYDAGNPVVTADGRAVIFVRRALVALR